MDLPGGGLIRRVKHRHVPVPPGLLSVSQLFAQGNTTTAEELKIKIKRTTCCAVIFSQETTRTGRFDQT